MHSQASHLHEHLADHGPILTDEALDPTERYVCQHCLCDFLGSEARPDFFGGVQGCPAPGCGACGLGIDVFSVNDPYIKGDGGYDHPNGDLYELRDSVLRIATIRDLDEVARFEGIRLTQLVELIEWNILSPEDRAPRAPSAMECVVFLCEWPEVRLVGYALHPARQGDSSSVRIDGLECDLDYVETERRAGLRAALLSFAKAADEFVEEERRIRVRWSR